MIPDPQTDMKSFAAVVRDMRTAQCDYFRRGRTQEQLAASKALERKVDGLARQILTEKPGLFDLKVEPYPPEAIRADLDAIRLALDEAHRCYADHGPRPARIVDADELIVRLINRVENGRLVRS
jgi:hypothetical protein